MITIQDVANEAGVSLATVSRVVNNSLVVSESTRRKVLDVIEKLGYQPQSRTGTGTKKQVLLISDVSDPEGSNSLYHALSDLGYQMFVFYNCERNDPDRDLLQFLQQQSDIAGIILQNFVRPVGDALFAVLDEYPVVQCETHLPFSKTVTIGVNHFQAAYDGTEHLLSLGCQRIAFVGNALNVPAEAGISRSMINGYRSALLDKGYLPEQDLLIECDFTVEGAYEGLQDFLASGNRADGFVCPLDTMVLGSMRAMHNAGLSLPEDGMFISLMGMWCSAFTIPSISALNYPSDAISQEAARQIDLMISGQPGEGQSILLPHSFTYRESTGEG